MANWWDDLSDEDKRKLGVPVGAAPSEKPAAGAAGASVPKRTLGDDLKTIPDWVGSRVIDIASAIGGAPKAWQDTAAVENQREEAERKAAGRDKRWYDKTLPELLGIKFDPTLPKSFGEEAINKSLFDALPFVTKTATPGPAGKYVDEGIKAVAMGLPFGGASRVGAVANAIGGVGSSVAGDIPGIKDTQYEPLARAGVGTLAGLGVSLPSMMRTTEGRLIRNATKGTEPTFSPRTGKLVNPAEGGVDWEAARRRHQEADGLLTGTEALADSASHPVATLDANVRASGRGGAIDTMRRDRMPLLDQRFEELMQKLAPGARADLGTVEGNLATASDAAINRTKALRSDMAQPHYDRGKLAPLDPRVDRENYAALLGLQHRLTPGTLPQQVASEMVDLRNKAPKTIVTGGLERDFNTGDLMAQLDEWQNTRALQAFQGDPKKIEAVRKHLKPVLDKTVADIAATNPDIAKGESYYRQLGKRDPRTGEPLPSVYTQEVEDVRRRLGPIAKTEGGEPGKTMEAFGTYGVKPGAGATPETIRDMIERLRLEDRMAMNPTKTQRDKGMAPLPEDPKSAERAFTEYLRQRYDAAGAGPRGDPRNLYQGSDFVRNVGGTGDAAANMRAWVNGISGSPTTAAGFEKLMGIMQRHGYSRPTGSDTAARTQANKEMAEGGFVSGALSVPSASPLKWARDAWTNMRYGRGYERLAAAITDPDAVKKLHELALRNPDSARAQALARSLATTIFQLSEE